VEIGAMKAILYFRQ